MIRLSVCFFAMIMFVSNISAQNISGLSIPKTPAPAWAQELFKAQPNVFVLDKDYQEYYKKNSYQKTDWTKYYRRWRRMITPFIQENGQLMSTDQINHKRKFAEGKKTLSSEQNDIWTPVGPLTSHWKSEDNADMDACPWQANIYCL